MPPIDQQIKKINETIGTVNSQATSLGFKSDLPTIGSPLSSDSLTSQPDFDLTTSEVSAPQADRFQQEQRTESEVQKDQFAQRAEARAAQLQAQTATAFDDQIGRILSAPTFSELEAQQYQNLGVDEKQLQVDKLSTQMIAEQDALRTKIEDIQKKGGGLKVGAQAEIANLERESISKQADLALLQLAAQDQLDYATRVADRAVNAMYEREEKITQVYKDIYERNKELFDTAEQRAFDVALNDRERKLTTEKENMQILQSTKIEALKMAQLNNAPQSVIDAIVSSESPEEVLKTGGAFVAVDMLDRKIKQQQYYNSILSGQKAEAELDALLNPPVENESLPDKTLEMVNDLSDGKRTDLANGRQTIAEISRMKEIVESLDDMTILTGTSKEAREFNRLAANVADKLARERTGAVVGKDEEKQFKKILGVGLFNQLRSTDTEVISALDNMLNLHQENIDLIDPTGEINSWMDSREFDRQYKSDSKEIETVWGVNETAIEESFAPSNFF